MAREKFQTLTEQMFYILLCLQRECCGVDVMDQVSRITEGRVIIGPGTLYSLLESFQQEGFIQETRVEGRKRSYQITVKGRLRLEEEVRRLRRQTEDYVNFGKEANA
ncbi:MAG: PadR family transcriptional regulator [Oscillospiraceae bacterium]|nr:PadR family transcriptional regulator [Oscillospiraceae bacterium]